MARQTAPAQSEPGQTGLAAHVRLGRREQGVSVEFVILLSTTIFLTGFGFVMVLSATSASQDPFDVALKQGVFAAVGLPLMLLLSRFPVTFWRKIAWFAMIGAIAFQLLIYSPLGIDQDGNVAWVNFGVFQAQPAEFLKLALAIWLALILSRKQAHLDRARELWIPLAPVCILALAAVLGGGDMGTAMMLGLVIFGALFFAGVKLRHFIIPGLLVVGGIVALVLSSANRRARFTSFLDPNCTDEALCYQPLHGMWALANGGVFGVGLGNSVEKYGWLPARGNDFIFAIVGEELGLIGCIVVLGLFAVFCYACVSMMRRTTDQFVRVATGAIMLWIVGQALVNIAVVLRLAPPLGVPLPFLSQGGTSLLSVLIACGVLLSFARALPRHATEPAATKTAAARTPVQQLD